MSLVDVFHAIAATKGVKLCLYPEEKENVQEAKCHAEHIKKEKKLLKMLYEIDNKMAFKKSEVEKALKTVLKTKQKTWNFKKEDASDWLDTMRRRIRCLCRIVGQQALRASSKQTAWYKELELDKPTEAKSDDKPTGEKSESEDEVSENEQSEDEKVEEKEEANANEEVNDKPLYVVCFFDELMLATKSDARNPKGKKELSAPLVPGDIDLELVVARFEDGAHDVPGLTNGTLRSLQSKRTSPVGTGRLYEKTHIESKNLITIQQRVDRSLLLSLYEQSAQRLQVRMDIFGVVADQHTQLPADSETLKEAMAFMVEIADLFVENKISKMELKTERDKRLKTRAQAVAPKATAKSLAKGKKNLAKGKDLASKLTLKRLGKKSLDAGSTAADVLVEPEEKGPTSTLATSASTSTPSASTSTSSAKTSTSSSAPKRHKAQEEEYVEIEGPSASHLEAFFNL